MHVLARYGWIGLIVMFPLFADAACPDQSTVASYLADFKAARASKGFGSDLSLADAECARGKLVKELPQVLGRVVGYKAGFTNPAAQERFGVKGPAWGVMFEKMMVDSGAKLPAKFGARPQYEADFIAVAKDAGLADAKTPLEALRHSEERYRDLVENSEALIYTHDPEGKLLSVNRAMVRHLGYSLAEELLGRKLSEFVASDVLHLFDAYLNTVMKDGHAEGLMKLLTRGGEERFFEYRNSLRAEGLARPIVHGIAHDVTERMQVERALAKRTRRMQTLRTITLEITRELDLKTLLGLITRRAAALLGAASGAVYLWDETAQVLSAQAVYSLGEWTRGKSLRLGEEIAGTVAQRRDGMIVNDYETSPHASSFFLERAGFTAVVAEPLVYHDRLIGVLTVNNEGTWQLFSEEDRNLLGILAADAAIAIENARLYSALADSKRRLEELYELGVAMQEDRTLRAGLDLILKGAQTVLRFDRMNILIADPDGTRLSAVASLGTEEPIEQIYVPVGPEGGGIAKAFLERKDIVWEGAGPVPEEWRLAPPYSEIKAFRSRCFVIVPLIVRGAAIGVLGADKKFSQEAIPSETIHLLKIFAAQAAITIDDARLYEEVTRHAKELGKVEDQTDR